MDEKKHINQAVIISDLHCGCQMGLCPPTPITLDGGGTYNSSDLQKKVWLWWREFWDSWVPVVTRGEPYIVVLAGDTTEGRHHNSVTQISQNLADQRNIAIEILSPIIDKIGNGKLYMIRGTESHVGASGENEEMLAQALNAVPDDIGNYARNGLWMQLGGENGMLVHVLHHIGTSSSTAYETSALMREYNESLVESARWQLKPPQIVVRAHRHRFSEIKIPTAWGDGICVTTPCWQLPTSFTYKIAGGRNSLPQFGGILCRMGDEEGYTRHWVKGITRTPTVMA